MNKAHKFKQTEIGLIPEDWNIHALNKKLIDINKKSINKNYSFTKINYYDTSSVCKGVFDKPKKFIFSDAPSRLKD